METNLHQVMVLLPLPHVLLSHHFTYIYAVLDVEYEIDFNVEEEVKDGAVLRVDGNIMTASNTVLKEALLLTLETKLPLPPPPAYGAPPAPLPTYVLIPSHYNRSISKIN
ncbi:unnamed protein product [Lepeophtheirus salmonis]|uniref:(salmon louse) hypothetical protein n=1 Tax=Lepeophtheirus salmonis TaxID=72036 RepID=A0A817FCP4_LEPSM|nr:unnamed protein product [Lepeophtheirus salmonis]